MCVVNVKVNVGHIVRFGGNLTGGCTPFIRGTAHSSQVSSEWERSPDLAGEIRSLTLCY